MGRKLSDMAKINSYISKELKRKFKTAYAAVNRSMYDVMIELIEGWIDEQDTETAPLAFTARRE